MTCGESRMVEIGEISKLVNKTRPDDSKKLAGVSEEFGEEEADDDDGDGERSQSL